MAVHDLPDLAGRTVRGPFVDRRAKDGGIVSRPMKRPSVKIGAMQVDDAPTTCARVASDASMRIASTVDAVTYKPS